MLTDIFANRYATIELFPTFEERYGRLIVQSFRMLDEQVCPYFVKGKESPQGKAFWTDIQRRLAMEFGVQSLSSLSFAYDWNSKRYVSTWTMNKVCENWMLKPFDASTSADQFIKDRLSLVELGFRTRAEKIANSYAGPFAARSLCPPCRHIQAPCRPILRGEETQRARRQ